MLLRSILVLVVAGCVPAALLQRRDTTISSSQRNPTNGLGFGSPGQRTSVDVGVTYWLSGSGPHNFYGNVFTNGRIITSQTDYQTTNDAVGQIANYTGHTTIDGDLNITSTGSIFLNDFEATSGAIYDWRLRTFTNYGSLQFCGSGDTGGSAYQLHCDIDCYNYGTIEYGQYDDSQGATFIWRSEILAPAGATNFYNIYNYGAFRITSVVFHNVQNWRGNGCIVIGSFGVLYLEDGTGIYQSYQNGAYLPALSDQSIAFFDNTGVLHMDPQVYSHNINFGPQIYGFASGCAIEFYETIDTTGTGYSYDPSTGILNVLLASGNEVNIKLGLGYDPDRFYSAQNPTNYNPNGFDAIFYGTDAPDQATPTTCQPALPSCTDPAQTAGSVPTAISETYTTQTAAYTGTGTVTSTIAVASGTQPGTVIVYVPATYVTTSRPYTGTSQLNGPITSTVPPSGTAPGTVIIYTPTQSRPATVTTTFGRNQCSCTPV